MSDGKKAAAEEREEQRFAEHCKRLEELGIEKIAEILEELKSQVISLEAHSKIMSRSGWACFDYVHRLLNRLG